ncbi:hypothetical protein SAMN05216233_101400 [Desulfoluna spongiiphila]|uniref:Uncharacterized protein n=1 Tax=Desulfoluna spongiiphila TaxID=419481 RepID=A0A1G5ARG2_9BACT|nr:hypothetical protein SAMN05216233_101400 [Desulfoluna spongiiphila]
MAFILKLNESLSKKIVYIWNMGHFCPIFFA